MSTSGFYLPAPDDGGVIGIVVSRADEASVHIGEHLRDLTEWTTPTNPSSTDEGGASVRRTDGFELREFEDLHIHLREVDTAFTDPDLMVFASRHSGDTGPLLTAHFPGNFGPAEYGGNSAELAPASPPALAQVYERLQTVAPDGYDVGIECTHHGPTDLDIPALFVEVGSTKAHWRDPAAARAVANAILDLRDLNPITRRAIVGFGGGHYAPRFTRILRETDWAVGHIAAEWSLNAMEPCDASVLRQAFEQSGATYAVLDGDHVQLADEIHQRGYRVVSETWLRETTGIARDVVNWAEEQLSPVDEGLRFGAKADRGSAAHVYDIDHDLIKDANAVSMARVREAVSRHTVAFETDEGGNRVTGRVALPADTRPALITALLDILQDRFDTVTRDNDTITATESVFDPDRARALGVPEGPAFGALVNGETVTIDGTDVTPAMVHTNRTRQYQI